MSNDIRFLNMKAAGEYIGQSYRWMQRNYVMLIRAGVKAYRMPKDASRGRLMFSRASLDEYVECCRITGDFERPVGI